MPFTISLNLNVTVKIFEIHVHRLLNNVASFFISFWNVKASRIEMQGSRLEMQGSKARGSKARGSKYKAQRLEARRLEARNTRLEGSRLEGSRLEGSTYRILEHATPIVTWIRYCKAYLLDFSRSHFLSSFD